MRHETRQRERSPAGHQKLDAWRLADDLTVELFRATRKLPPDLRWLSSQVLRAATSVPANIAEGYARTSKKEFAQFLSIARASLAEVEYFIHFMARTELISHDQEILLTKLRRDAASVLQGLIKYARVQANRSAGNGNAVYEAKEEYLADA